MNKLEKVLKSGQALEKFQQMVTALGGPKDFIQKTEKYLPQAKIIRPIFAKGEGYVKAMEPRNIGLSLIGLKGGRIRPDQKLDYATGFSDFCQIGDYVSKDKPLAFVHAQTEADALRAEEEIRAAVKLDDKELKAPHSAIIKRIKE